MTPLAEGCFFAIKALGAACFSKSLYSKRSFFFAFLHETGVNGE
jgi:hypothetical protein